MLSRLVRMYSAFVSFGGTARLTRSVTWMPSPLMPAILWGLFVTRRARLMLRSRMI